MIDAVAQVMVSPINQFLSGLLVGFLLIKYSIRFKRTGKILMLLSSVWLFLCSQYFFSHWLISPLENAYPPIKIDNPQWQTANGIWVLACYHFDAEDLPTVSQFNHCSLERLVHAANMYREKKIPIYLSGADFVKESEQFHTTQAAAFLLQLGVNEEDIVFINHGKNTFEEASAVSKISKRQTLAVVSSATHGFRLGMMLSELNIDFNFVPVHFSTKGAAVYRTNFPAIQSLERSERAMYEYAAIVKFYMFNKSA